MKNIDMKELLQNQLVPFDVRLSNLLGALGIPYLDHVMAAPLSVRKTRLMKVLDFCRKQKITPIPESLLLDNFTKIREKKTLINLMSIPTMTYFTDSRDILVERWHTANGSKLMTANVVSFSSLSQKGQWKELTDDLEGLFEVIHFFYYPHEVMGDLRGIQKRVVIALAGMIDKIDQSLAEPIKSSDDSAVDSFALFSEAVKKLQESGNKREIAEGIYALELSLPEALILRTNQGQPEEAPISKRTALEKAMVNGGELAIFKFLRNPTYHHSCTQALQALMRGQPVTHGSLKQGGLEIVKVVLVKSEGRILKIDSYHASVATVDIEVFDNKDNWIIFE
jgi:hypothetical protein